MKEQQPVSLTEYRIGKLRQELVELDQRRWAIQSEMARLATGLTPIKDRKIIPITFPPKI